MITLNIQPSLQNIQERLQGNNPLTSFIQGQQAGQQMAVGQNQLAQIQRDNQARQFAGAAASGDPTALAQVAALSPQMATQISPLQQQAMERAGALLYAGKQGGPAAWQAAVQKVAQLTGSQPDPQELDYNNADAVIAQHQTLSQALDQQFKQQQLAIQKQGQDLQLKALENQINTGNRNYNLEAYKAAMEAWNAQNPGGAMFATTPMPKLSDYISGAASGVGGTSIPSAGAPAGSGTQPAQAPAGAAVSGVTTSQPIPQPNASGFPAQRPTVQIDPQTGQPDPKSQQDYLAAVPPAIAPLLKAAAEYKLDPNKMFQLKGGARAQFDALMQEYTGGQYNSQTYPLQFAMQKSINNGPYSTTLNSSEKVIQHMALLKDYADALNNGDVQAVNSVVNRIKAEFGAAAPTNFGELANGVGSELAKAMKGNGTLDQQSQQEAQQAFGTGLSPAQITGAIQTGMHMLASAVDPISFRYKEVMGKPLNWASPKTQSALSKLGLNPADFGGAAPAAGAASAANVIMYDAQGNRVQ